MHELTAGIIGAGFFGGLHAKKYKEVGKIPVSLVFDPNAENAGKMAETYGARVADNALEVIANCPLVSITAPADQHYSLAKSAISAGRAVYVEKPLALSAEEAEGLVELADRRNVVLQVGHQERFVFNHFGLLKISEKPTAITCMRAGPYTGRATDVSTVLDLMIHDIDLVHALVKGSPESLAASAKRLHGPYADEAEAKFTVGATEVHLIASRMREARERWIEIVYPSGTIRIDMLARTIENSTPFTLTSAFERTNDDLPSIAEDPLGVAIGSFVDAVRYGDRPLVNGRQAARALKTALAVSEASGAENAMPVT